MPQNTKKSTGIGPSVNLTDPTESLARNEAERKRINQQLDLVLREKKEPNLMQKLYTFPASVLSPKTREISGPEKGGYDYQALAAFDMLDRYPEAASKVRNVQIGQDLGDDTWADYSPALGRLRLGTGIPNIEYARDAMRHELGHAQGLGESGPYPNAYNLTDLSMELRNYNPYPRGKDIYLPLEPAKSTKGIGPTKPPVKKK